MQFIKALSKLGYTDLALAGGKAASLGELTRAGFPVPPGFCLTTDAYRAFVAANNLQPEILRLGSDASAGDPVLLETASASIRALFTAGQIPPDLASEICAAYAQLCTSHSALPTFPVAVRSSATAEDLPGASFAGQQDTFLNVTGEQAVLEAVRQCWASLWTSRAIAYRQREGIPPQDVTLAVVVQQLIPAEAAGVLFTANPLTGNRNEVVIDAAWGLGEAIVGGLVTPDHFVVDKATHLVKVKQVADKQTMTVRTPNGTEEQPTPEALRSEPAISAAQIAELTDLARRIETHAGRPVDVEWAISDGHLFVLQARPITHLPPDLMGMEWSRQILIERYPDPVTPFTCSVINVMLLTSFEKTFLLLGLNVPDGLPFFRLIYGRPYINLTAMARGFESLPFRPPAALGSSGEAHTRRQLPGLGILPIFGNVLKIVLTSHRQWERLLPPFIAVVKQESELAWETLPTAAILEGIARHEAQSAALLANHTATIIATEPIVQILQTLTRAWLRDEDGQLAITLLSGLTGNKTVETNRALWRLAASTRGNDALRQAIAGARAGGWREPIALAPGGADFLMDFDAFLQAYGHRAQGYDMVNPTWREQPDLVLELLRLSFDGSVADPGEGEARKAAERKAAARAARQRLSLLKRFLFDRVMALAQTYFRLRENQQFYMMQGVPLVRRTLLTLARRFQEAGLLSEVEDVFFLENKEVRALAAKMAGLPTDSPLLPADSRHLVAERQAEFERNRQIDAPLHLGGEPAYPEAQTSGAPRGVPASRGVVTGRARLVRGPDDFGKVRRGEIIVAPATTPAWTPLFGVAAGLVTEFGGLLSHAGVVAREYGLPAVLGVPDAMRLIQDGDEITVDGDRGEVRIKSPTIFPLSPSGDEGLIFCTSDRFAS